MRRRRCSSSFWIIELSQGVYSTSPWCW